MLTTITGSDTSAAQIVVRFSFSASSRRASSSFSLVDAPSAPAASPPTAPSVISNASYPAERTSSISNCDDAFAGSKSTVAVSVE